MEFVCLSIASGVLFLGSVKQGRTMVVALLAVATLLYIKTTDAFLTMQSLDKFESDFSKDRLNTMIAG